MHDCADEICIGLAERVTDLLLRFVLGPFGVQRILESYELWLQTQDRAKRFIFLRCEDLH